MLSRQQSYINQPSHISQSTIPDAWRNTFLDLKATYESLKHEHFAMQLENGEYQKHVAELQRQNDELKIQLLQVKSSVDHEQNMKPILKRHISSIEDSLADNDLQIHKLEETTQRYLNTINIITSENVSIKKENMIVKQENDRLRIELQRSHQKHDKLQQSRDDALAANERQMSLLQDQLQAFQDQIYASKNKEKLEIPDLAMASDVLQDDTPIISDCRRTLVGSAFRLSALQIQRLSMTSSRTSFILSPRMSHLTPYFNDGDAYDQDGDDLHENLLKLEEENTALRKKLNEMHAQLVDEDSADSGDTCGDNDDVLSQFSEDDLDEMQQLFDKCDEEKVKADGKRARKHDTNTIHCALWLQFFR